MSTWTGIDLGDYSIVEWQNTYQTWLFKDSDRVRESRPSGKFIGYRMTVETLARRLELRGVNRQSVELEMSEHKALWLEELMDLRRYLPEFQLHIDGLENSTIDTWLKLIPIAKRFRDLAQDDYEAFLRSPEPDKTRASLPEREQNLLEFMCSDYDEGPYYSSGDFHFPCQSIESYAWVILQLAAPGAMCELDISGLIDSGWVDDFEDLAEHQAGETKFCERARLEVQEITKLSETDVDNLVLQRLSYSGLITILEAYLSDIAKREVLNREAIKRRFVEKFKPFSDSQKTLNITEIYNRLEQLDHKIIECIDRQSFHSVKTIYSFFPSVLLVNLSDNLKNRLTEAVDTRHHIVHRGGKTKKGERIDVSQEDVQSVARLVVEAMESIDSQVVDGLIEV